MPLAIAYTRTIHGSAAVPVRVETHLANGLPCFNLVGLAETAVRESRDRVRSALLNSGFEFPQRRITVSLAPGDIPKQGTRFDLAIAVAILVASGQLPPSALERSEYVAELALDGTLRPVRASVATALACAAAARRLVVSPENAAVAAAVAECEVAAAHDLAAVARDALEAESLPRVVPSGPVAAVPGAPDLGDVVGQQRARRVLEIAAAGRHNLLLVGPPGTGKTMLASRLPGILPPLDAEAAAATAAIHSIAGYDIDPRAFDRPPFRAPHHSASAVALIGGGRQPRPGEISLAHEGVLFLDEFPEFERRALEALREPLETAGVTVARAAGAVFFPARLQLVAAMNPCPCGYAGDPQIECRCSPAHVERYRRRVSGPLIERIDLHLRMPRQKFAVADFDRGAAETSSIVRARVMRTRQRQLQRQNCANGDLPAGTVIEHCRLDSTARQMLNVVAERQALSARGYHRLLRVARTVADMDSADNITEDHVAEALSLRPEVSVTPANATPA